MANKYRLNGTYLTQSLFIEQRLKELPTQRQDIPVVFSLYGGYPDLVDCTTTFLALDDPTGYLWVKQYLDGDFDHWDALLKASWFRQALDRWQRELKTKMQFKALKQIRAIAKINSPAPQAILLAANKYLAEAGWEKKASDRGRPSKEELRGELKHMADQASVREDDIQRMGLTVIKGGKRNVD